MSPPKRSKLAFAWSGLVLLLKIAVSMLVLSTPLLGMWVGSSLAAYRGGARWVPIVTGLVGFPLLPLAWDALSEWRRSKKPKRERILKFGDRLLLRTVAVNLAFLAVLLAARPEAAFEALSTRGDWMLRGRHGAAAERTRGVLFKLAGGIEWLYKAAHKDPFKNLAPDDANPTLDDGKAGRLAADGSTGGGSGGAPSKPATSGGPAPSGAPDRPTKPNQPPAPVAPAWPFAESVEPVVRDMPRSVETGVASIARYVSEHEPDPFLRVKALHDWVADRVAYDADALANRRYPPQDAASVLATRKAVCAGYARLFSALAKAAGVEAVYLTGDARTGEDDLDGLGHAWNAVEIAGRWYLLDATWDSGSVDGRTFKKQYRSDYFLTPPEVFGIDHFPSTARWQLRAPALTRGAFMRQPMMRPSFFARGMQLVRPDRSQVDVSGAFDALIANPRGQHMLATSEPKGGGARADCDVAPGRQLAVHCVLADRGVFRVILFANASEVGTYDQVGTLEAVSR